MNIRYLAYKCVYIFIFDSFSLYIGRFVRCMFFYKETYGCFAIFVKIRLVKYFGNRELDIEEYIRKMSL